MSHVNSRKANSRKSASRDSLWLVLKTAEWNAGDEHGDDSAPWFWTFGKLGRCVISCSTYRMAPSYIQYCMLWLKMCVHVQN